MHLSSIWMWARDHMSCSESGRRARWRRLRDPRRGGQQPRAFGSGLAVGVARVTHLSLGLLSFPVGDLAGSRRVRLPDRLPMSQTVSGRIAQLLDFVGSIRPWLISSRSESTATVVPMPACKLRQPPDCRCRLNDLRIIHAILI